MILKSVVSKGVHHLRSGLATLAIFQLAIGAPFANAAAQPKPVKPADAATVSPIKHVIVIIGENRSFDHVFATYVPRSGDKINNLLSEGIID
jgi:phospholipase C